MDKFLKNKNFTRFIALVIVFVFISFLQAMNNVERKKTMDAHILSTKIIHETIYYEGSNLQRYTPSFYFNVDGREYVCKERMRLDKKMRDKPYKIYYNSNNPNECLPEFVEHKRIFSAISLLLASIVLFGCLYKIAQGNSNN